MRYRVSIRLEHVTGVEDKLYDVQVPFEDISYDNTIQSEVEYAAELALKWFLDDYVVGVGDIIQVVGVEKIG